MNLLPARVRGAGGGRLKRLSILLCNSVQSFCWLESVGLGNSVRGSVMQRKAAVLYSKHERAGASG